MSERRIEVRLPGVFHRETAEWFGPDEDQSSDLAYQGIPLGDEISRTPTGRFITVSLTEQESERLEEHAEWVGGWDNDPQYARSARSALRAIRDARIAHLDAVIERTNQALRELYEADPDRYERFLPESLRTEYGLA